MAAQPGQRERRLPAARAAHEDHRQGERVELGLPKVVGAGMGLSRSWKSRPGGADVPERRRFDVERVGPELSGVVEQALFVDPRAAQEPRPVVRVVLDDLEREAGALAPARDELDE